MGQQIYAVSVAQLFNHTDLDLSGKELGLLNPLDSFLNMEVEHGKDLPFQDYSPGYIFQCTSFTFTYFLGRPIYFAFTEYSF